MPIEYEPILTELFDDSDLFVPDSGSVYISRSGLEERSQHAERFAADQSIVWVTIVDEGVMQFTYRIGTSEATVPLRSSLKLKAFWDLFNDAQIYLDITGLRHHVWMPLLRSALESCSSVRVVYVEPFEYRASLSPTEGEIYDLSETLRVAPIPGFTSLARVRGDFCFIPLLGFEGTRVSFLLEHVQPEDDKVIPIIGLPGFRAEYPFTSYIGNRLPLTQSEAWRHVRFADAHCPFSLYYLLEELSIEFRNCRLKIAPIGTKPHALGAVLFALQDPSDRELIYDHPVRRQERTGGRSRLLNYDISGFFK